MAYIMETDTDDGARALNERVTLDDMGGEFFRNHLVERLRWAVADVETQNSHATAPADPSSST